MIYTLPGTTGAKHQYKTHYDNFINGKWTPPVRGEYFDVITPLTGQPYTKAARSGADDIELALDAAHAAAEKWGKPRRQSVLIFCSKLPTGLKPILNAWPTLKPSITARPFAKP